MDVEVKGKNAELWSARTAEDHIKEMEFKDFRWYNMRQASCPTDLLNEIVTIIYSGQYPSMEDLGEEDRVDWENTQFQGIFSRSPTPSPEPTMQSKEIESALVQSVRDLKGDTHSLLKIIEDLTAEEDMEHEGKDGCHLNREDRIVLETAKDMLAEMGGGRSEFKEMKAISAKDRDISNGTPAGYSV